MSGLPHAAPEDVGLDPRRLESAFRLLEEWTSGEDAPIPGGAILVGRNGKIVPPRFLGRQGPERDAEPIREDGIFLLASISKPITYLGAMLLVERGQLNLCDRVTRYIPEFAAHRKKDALVLHLFTHSSGLPDMLPNNAELRKAHAPLSRFIDGAIRETALGFPPGTDCRYQSMVTLVVAELIQRISGKTIHQFLKDEVFNPLGLESTALGSRGLAEERLVRVQTPDYQQDSDFGWNSAYWRELGSPWGGMFSTPEDFAVICQLMLGRGALGSVRLLAPRTVDRMTENRLQDQPDMPERIRRRSPWGLGWQLNHTGTRGSWGELLGPRVYGHSGATGTLAWIDPDTST
ncbi:MAG: beta-lactamase family protein, partial [Planctomycetales bacterium]